MGSGFLTPCRAPGCGIAASGGLCEKHRTGTIDTRGSAHARGYGKAHQRWRRLVLAADPVCHWPLEDGLLCLEPATIADHIIPRSAAPELRYQLENGQGLCQRHHNAKTAEEKSRLYRNTRGSGD